METVPPEIKQKSLNQWSHAELMALPHRQWDMNSSYDSVLIVSTRKKHDSGWAMMAIIGIRKNQPIEIAAGHCDDIEWKLPPAITFGTNAEYTIGQMRMDCAIRSGAVHAWSDRAVFTVGCSLSSVDIEVTFKPK